LAYIEDKYSNPHGGLQKHDCFDPLLVGLHDAFQSYRDDRCDIAKSEGLMNHVAAILDANLSENERILASEVLISLIKQAETDIRHNVAIRLSNRDDLHDMVLHHMVYGDIDIARPMLQYSPMLRDMDLMLVIQSMGADHWRAIAERDNISERIVTALIDKGEDVTMTSLLANDTIIIDDKNIMTMSESAMKSQIIAEGLMSYKMLPRDIAVSLYWHVSVAMRHDMVQKFDMTGRDIDRALEDCVQDFADTVLQSKTVQPSSLMNEIAGFYFAEGKISEQVLIDTLRRRQGRFFLALFSMKTGLRHQIVWTMMRQGGGQALAVACRAMNISKENFVSMFLLGRTIARADEAVNAEELKMAMRYYDGLTFKIAK
jgi:uncharacterized protein (DUF2336 family)